MRVLFDTDVLLDVLLRRRPFFDVAQSLFSRVEHGALEGAVSATSIATVFYFARKSLGREVALQGVRLLLKLFRTAPVTHEVLAAAIDLGFTDYEDAVLHGAARTAGVDGIVTRNTRDFRGSSIRVYSPNELEDVLATG